MSTADTFRCLRPFDPIVCIEEYDIDAITDSDYDSQIGFIRDLTLADAMKLYWLLEGFSVSISFSGSIEGNTIELDMSASTTTSSAMAPKSRVCDGPVVVLEAIGAGSITITPPDAPDVVEDYSLVFDWLTTQTATKSPVDSPVTKQTDGLYTLWYGLSGDHDMGLLFLRSAGRADLAFTTIASADLSIESGTTQITLCPDVGQSGSGSISAISFVPAYYTLT